ncbi:hypothetical protein, partial [Lacticaseibacillus yichunensis]
RSKRCFQTGQMRFHVPNTEVNNPGRHQRDLTAGSQLDLEKDHRYDTILIRRGKNGNVAF